MKKLAAELLKKSSIFSSISDDNLDKLAGLFNEKEYAAGEYIFREGDAGESVMLIKSGQVDIIKQGSSPDSDIHLARRASGEIFGEMALIENSPRFAGAKAVAAVSVLTLKKSDFEKLLTDNPRVVFQIMSTLSSRLRQADLQMIEDLERKNQELESANKSLTELAEELRKSNNSLARAKEFRDKIINNASFFMITADSDGKITMLNGAAEHVFGISFNDAAGQRIDDIIKSSENGSGFAKIEKQMTEKGVWSGEVMTKKANGSQLIIDLTAVPIVTPDDKQETSSLFMGRDVTEEKHIQRQSFQLERMATRGEMAAEIAHELNNFLAIVSGNLELLVMDLNRGRYEKIAKKTTSMKEGIGRIAKFVEGLMSVAKPEAKIEAIDIHQFMDNELFFLRPQPRFKDIEFICRWGIDIPPLEIDKGQLQQVLFNLLNNSADALLEIPPGNKRVTIMTSYSKSDDMITLMIYDNGCGMTDEDYGRVFRQHFTTKKTGHGFGLLAVKRVIKSHGGRISMFKGPDGGACAKLELPRSGRPVSPKAVSAGV